MATQISEFRGLKSTRAVRPRTCASDLGAFISRSPKRLSRTCLTVEAVKKLSKKKQIVLLDDLPKLGKKGDLVTVSVGYWRNHLYPYCKAKAATPEILEAIREEEAAAERRRTEIKEQARRLAQALRTIGKFVIKKKAGAEGIMFGSVTRQDVVDTVFQQTGQELDKREILLPEIRELGTYDVSVKLHPVVIGFFKIVIEREKNVPGKR